MIFYKPRIAEKILFILAENIILDTLLVFKNIHLIEQVNGRQWNTLQTFPLGERVV